MRIAYYTSYLGKIFLAKYGKDKKFALSGLLKSLGIARCMMANGHHVEIFSPGVTTCEADIAAYTETEVYPEGTLVINYCHIISKRRRDPINQIRCQKLLLKKHKEHPFDIVVFYNITLGAAIVMPKLNDTIKVLEYEDNIFNKNLVGGKSNFNWSKRWMYNRIMRNTNGLIAVCTGLMLPDIKNKILVPGIISEEVIDNVSGRVNKLNPQRPVSIILTGGIHYSKGGDLLVGAMQYIKTPCIVKVYGNCNLDERLNDLIANIPEIHRFEFCGYMPHADLLKTLDSDADILINTTRNMGVGVQAAGFPFKMLEYASTGRPIVSSEIGKLNDEFNSHITYFNEETPESVAAAIERVISDYDAMVISALDLRNLVLGEYSITSLSEKLGTFLNGLKHAQR